MCFFRVCIFIKYQDKTFYKYFLHCNIQYPSRCVSTSWRWFTIHCSFHIKPRFKSNLTKIQTFLPSRRDCGPYVNDADETINIRGPLMWIADGKHTLSHINFKNSNSKSLTSITIVNHSNDIVWHFPEYSLIYRFSHVHNSKLTIKYYYYVYEERQRQRQRQRENPNDKSTRRCELEHLDIKFLRSLDVFHLNNLFSFVFVCVFRIRINNNN